MFQLPTLKRSCTVIRNIFWRGGGGGRGGGANQIGLRGHLQIWTKNLKFDKCSMQKLEIYVNQQPILSQASCNNNVVMATW